MKNERLSEISTMLAMLKNPHVHGIDAEMSKEELLKGIETLEKEWVKIKENERKTNK